MADKPSGITPGIFQVPFGRGEWHRRRVAEPGATPGGYVPPFDPPRGERRISTVDVKAGALAHLMAPRNRSDPDQIVRIEIDCSTDHPTLIEYTRDGNAVRRRVTEEERTVDAVLSDGRLVSVDVRVSAFDRDEDLLPTAGLTDLSGIAPASLTEFTDEDEDREDDV